MEKTMQLISTKEDIVNQLLLWRDHEIGLGFHPDTPGDDYVTQDRDPLFTAEQAVEYDSKIDKCFEVCEALGLDFYELTLDQFLPMLSVRAEMPPVHPPETSTDN
jgi:hypothetical protein